MVSKHTRGVCLVMAAATVGSPTGLLVRLLAHSSPWTILALRSAAYLAILGPAYVLRRLRAPSPSPPAGHAHTGALRELGWDGALGAVCLSTQSVVCPCARDS